MMQNTHGSRNDITTPNSSSVRWIGACALMGLTGLVATNVIASGPSFASKCAEIDKCIKVVSEITGDKYIFDSEVRGKMFSTDNVELTKDNASLLLSTALHANNFTRVPMPGEPGTYRVLRHRDARDSLLPKVTADVEHAPVLPNTWDLYHLTYQAKYPEVVEDMARTARSFAPANSRIIPIELSGQLLITSAVPEIKNIYEIIRGMDQKPTREWLNKLRERDREHREKKAAGN